MGWLITPNAPDFSSHLGTKSNCIWVGMWWIWISQILLPWMQVKLLQLRNQSHFLYILKLWTAMVQTHFCCCVCKFFSMCICNAGSNLSNLILFDLPSHSYEIVGLLDHPELSCRNLQAGPKGSPLDCVSTVTPVIEKTWIPKLQFMVMNAMKPPFGHIYASLKTRSTPWLVWWVYESSAWWLCSHLGLAWLGTMWQSIFLKLMFGVWSSRHWQFSFPAFGLLTCFDWHLQPLLNWWK